MPHPNHYPREHPTHSEWCENKSEIGFLYLERNWTLGAVQKHFRERGFHATGRQYKTKLKTWGFDTKKIRGDIWRAMAIVLEAESRRAPGFEFVFRVPVRGGQPKTVSAEQIHKQLRRDKSLKRPNLDEARLVLQENAVLYGCVEDFFGMERAHGHHMPSEHVRRQAWTALSHSPAISDASLSIDLATSERTSSTSSSPPFSPTTLCYTTSEVNPSERHSLPPIRNMLAGGPSHPAILPQLTSPLSSVTSSPNSVRSAAGPEILCSTKDFDAGNTLRSLHASLPLDSNLRQDLERFLGKETHHSVISPIADERERVAAWTAHYAVQAVQQQAKQPAEMKHQREHGKAIFRSLLMEHNRFIFPHFEWLITILSSSETALLVNHFLSDCCEVVDEMTNAQDINYRIPFHFVRALYAENEKELEVYYPRLQAGHEAIGVIWGKDSPNYLVIQYFYALHKLMKQQHDQAAQIAHKCLGLTETVLGPRHTLAINLLWILSRTSAELGDLTTGIACLADALSRMTDCIDGLQPLRNRFLGRLATLQVHAGDLPSAEGNLRQVIKFRSHRFDNDPKATMSCVEQLLDVVSLQGRQAEAKMLSFEMQSMVRRKQC